MPVDAVILHADANAGSGLSRRSLALCLHGLQKHAPWITGRVIIVCEDVGAVGDQIPSLRADGIKVCR